MNRPLLLDLFCGAGGASMGYHRAGFDVIGVDIEPQPNYPFEFIQHDAMELLSDLADYGPQYVLEDACGPIAAMHTSPPCQAYMRSGLMGNGHPDLLPSVRDLLEWTGAPWVIENVPGAPMRVDYLLCGSHFGLPIRRHRCFETSWHGFDLIACDHSRPVHGVYGHPHGQSGAWPGMLPGGLAEWSSAMGIDWMTASELSQAIPPAYTEHIGRQLIAELVTA